MLTMAWVLAACCLVGMQARLQDPPAELTVYLRDAMGLDSAQLTALRRGEAIVTEVPTELSREIAVFGIAATGLSRDAFVRRVLDVGESTRRPTRRHFGIFSRPPVLADVRDVVIAQRDVNELKDCRPGACVMKLPAPAMARLREDTDWSAGDARARVSAFVRQALIHYVADYRARGDAALVVYDDRGNIRASEAFADLLAETPRLYHYAPALRRYLTEYPAVTLPDASELLFWSEDEVPQLRPILSVTHLVVHTPPQRPDLTLVAAKQLYADHYFEAAFDLTCYVAAAAGGGGFVVVLRRYRFDQLSSGGPFDLRRRAVSGLRQQLLADLQRLESR